MFQIPMYDAGCPSGGNAVAASFLQGIRSPGPVFMSRKRFPFNATRNKTMFQTRGG